ncbi:MAG: hypothetical protein ABI183_01845, partial [Polyangiaceae bacterium]
MLRLRTVRQKLTALVGFSLLVVAVALFVLRWVLHEQLTHETTSRVQSSGDAFREELDEQIGDLEIVAHVLGTSNGVKDGVQKNDPAKVTRIAKRFFDAYPNIIGLASLISIGAAWRMASVMSNALSRVSDAHRLLAEHSQYHPVTGVTTGDELEELATG